MNTHIVTRGLHLIQRLSGYDWARHAVIYWRFRRFTMVPRREYFANLDLVERLDLPAGCVIECGVWRGGMIAGLATVLGAHRSYLLFDSFEGLPPAGELDGLAAKRYQSDPSGPWYFDNCRAERAFAERAMGLSGAKLYCLKKGWYSDTLPSFVPSEPVALLRLDADWYESTMCCLESLFDHVAPGGLILIDDYFAWDGCSRAVHDFLSRRSALERIQTFRGVCFIRKAQPQQLKQ